MLVYSRDPYSKIRCVGTSSSGVLRSSTRTCQPTLAKRASYGSASQQFPVRFASRASSSPVRFASVGEDTALVHRALVQWTVAALA